MNDEIPIDKLTKIYRKIRTRIQEITQEYDAAVGELELQKQEISNELKDRMLAGGLKTLRTDEGTVMLGMKTR